MVFHARAVGLRSSSAKSRFWRAHFGELLGGQLEIIQRLAGGAVDAVEKDGLGHVALLSLRKEAIVYGAEVAVDSGSIGK
jgi:hypothetical protein